MTPCPRLKRDGSAKRRQKHGKNGKKSGSPPAWSFWRWSSWGLLPGLWAGAHGAVCGKSGSLPGLGGQQRAMGPGAVCGHGNFPGAGSADSWRTSGDCGRIRLRRGGGNPFVSAGHHPGRHHGVPAGAQMGCPGAGAILPAGAHRVPAVHAEHTEGAVYVYLLCFCPARRRIY